MVLSKYVGAQVRRKEDPRLITGSSTYVDDLQLPGMAHVALVRSPYPHARIKAIDATAALAMPGVSRVVTGAELKTFLHVAPGTGEEGEVPEPQPEESDTIPVPTNDPLATEKVRYVGDPVAAVIAATSYQAEDA